MSCANTWTSATLVARTGRAGSRYVENIIRPLAPQDRQLDSTPGLSFFWRTV